jgi:two-component system cell cycle response regulator
VAVIAVAVVARHQSIRVRALEASRGGLRDAMVGIGAALGGEDRQALFSVLLHAGTHLTGGDEAVLWALTGTGLQARAATDPAHARARLALGEGLAGWVADTGEPARWPPSARSPSGDEPRCGAALAVPVFSEGRVFGVLSVHRHAAEPFTEAVCDDVAAVARQAGAALETMGLHEETRRLSLTDGLTGLWNRRQFDLRAGQELERATRFGERFGIVLLDLDGFKEVNDHHGHAVGDAVLVEVARRLMGSTREVDLVARFGGEEFVLVLPQTELDGAVRVADKVRSELCATPVPTEAGPITVSVSAGVACHPEHGANTAELLAAADEALYRAKEAGKNQVVPARGVPFA